LRESTRLHTRDVAQIPRRGVRIAAAAEIYAGEDGIVNVYGDNPVGRELIDRARASLAAEDVIRATEAGRRLTIAETLEKRSSLNWHARE
jgi:hypothetical protein